VLAAQTLVSDEDEAEDEAAAASDDDRGLANRADSEPEDAGDEAGAEEPAADPDTADEYFSFLRETFFFCGKHEHMCAHARPLVYMHRAYFARFTVLPVCVCMSSIVVCKIVQFDQT